MFSKEYWYLGLATLLVGAFIVLAAMQTARHKWVTRIILWGTGLFVLIYQGKLLADTGRLYVAFSYFCYFLYGVAVFVPLRPLKATAAFSCFLSGAIYLVCFLFYPDMVVRNMAQGGPIWISWLMHVIMFSGSLILLGQCRLVKWDILPIVLFLTFFVVYTELAEHVYHAPDINPVSTGLAEATLILQIAPNFVIRWWWYIVWYIAIAAAFWGLWELTTFINRRLCPAQVVSKKDFWFVW